MWAEALETEVRETLCGPYSVVSVHVIVGPTSLAQCRMQTIPAVDIVTYASGTRGGFNSGPHVPKTTSLLWVSRANA